MAEKDLIENMWGKLQEIFEPLIKTVTLLDNSIIHSLGKSNNDLFPLRAYLSFMKNSDGGEIAITVDVKNKNGCITLESDISGDEGKILAEGPLFEGDFTKENLEQWLAKFETFLDSSQDVLKSELLALV